MSAALLVRLRFVPLASLASLASFVSFNCNWTGGASENLPVYNPGPYEALRGSGGIGISVGTNKGDDDDDGGGGGGGDGGEGEHGATRVVTSATARLPRVNGISGIGGMGFGFAHCICGIACIGCICFEFSKSEVKCSDKIEKPIEYFWGCLENGKLSLFKCDRSHECNPCRLVFYFCLCLCLYLYCIGIGIVSLRLRLSLSCHKQRV